MGDPRVMGMGSHWRWEAGYPRGREQGEIGKMSQHCGKCFAELRNDSTSFPGRSFSSPHQYEKRRFPPKEVVNKAVS